MTFDFSIDEACAILGGLREYFRIAKAYESAYNVSGSLEYDADKAEYWHNECKKCHNAYFKIVGEFIPEEIAK